MKVAKSIVAACLIGCVSFPAMAGSDKHDDHAPRHGGTLTEVKEVQFELVAKPNLMQLFVSDHGKPVNMGSGTAKLTLLSGTSKTEVPLVVSGDRFEAKGEFTLAPGTKAVAQVTLGGKSYSPRFVLK